jgi:quinolinate synthase
MTVTRVTQQNAEIYRQMSINNLEKRHEALRIEEQRIKLDLHNNEQKRVEMNRMMNRPGQNIDKMA